MAPSPRSTSVSTRCTICGATFSRPEHLARHRKSHTREKPFRCPVCGKTFARQDVMSRHGATHDQDARVTSVPTHVRACRQCAACRVRCSRTEPCGRCSERNLACVYPPDGTTRTPPPAPTGPQPESSATQNIGHGGDNNTPLRERLPDATVVAGIAINGPTANLDVHNPPANNPGMLQTVSWPRQLPAFENPGMLEQRSYHGGYVVENAANEQIVDLLAMNWISPEYSHGLDWNGMFPAENPTQIDTSKPPFSFLFQAPAAMGGVGDALGPVDGQTNHPSPAHAPYAAEVESSSATFHRRFSACGPSTNGSARTGSDAPTSYVDGGEARAPFPGRVLQQHQGTKDHTTNPQAPPPVQENETVSQTGSGFSLVTDSAYNNMVRNIHRQVTQQLININTTRFPSHQRIAELARLYFTNFHSTFPFIRRTDFHRKTAKHWILLLAVAAIGTKYAQANTPESSSDNVLLGILDTILNSHIHSTEGDLDGATWNVMLDESDKSHLALPTLQALILNIIWKLHSGKKPMVKRALAETYYLVTECTRMGLLSSASDETSPSLTDEATVLAWLRKESRLRTGMMIWLLDFMMAYEYNAPPLMQLVDANGPLPCPDQLWEAPVAVKIGPGTNSSVTLLDAVEMLYIEKRLPDNLTEFTTILLIHAVLRRSKEAIKQTQTQLSSWIPTATAQHRTFQHNRDAEAWPPATPVLSRWRNSACDGLDILHWRANAKAAVSAGWEHPTILYLHVSRLVLLTPTAQLHTLAVLAGDPAGMSNPKYVEARAVVLRWAMHDSFKARLSVIHAGAIYWHVRRYSSGGFLEPFAVYMSTLVLWAYSISTQSARTTGALGADNGVMQGTTSGNHQHPTAEEAVPSAAEMDEDPDPFFIHLDRPCDDEMVQTYIRKGSRISAYMARVGNIMDEGAAAKIVQEGIRLLAAPAANPGSTTVNSPGGEAASGASGASGQWGIEQSFAGVLESLLQVMGGQRRQ
ncbi:fungal-specific transcription factor domain-containing protein [Parachaetomium inaequale]|uniref:Fungal-specific transcription factor domain-containing protein n=1 Tax=Parachaetomium inaequale TaxID=2588326 RepID=A0AAN6PI48_9PEZI|nr:fungal-specific transcription factor domain-containing protein [Parachaetomium inaequale]